MLKRKDPGTSQHNFGIDGIVAIAKTVTMRIILVFALFALLVGCDIFELRKAEEPLDDPLWNDFYTEYSLTLENLRYSYADSRNVVKYLSLFHPDYIFHFASQDISEYNITQTWDRTMERDMLFNLHNWADDMALNLTEQSVDIQANEIKYYGSYLLNINRNKASQSYTGNLEIHFRLVNGLWLIYRWYDYRSGSSATWGKLKYDFSQ